MPYPYFSAVADSLAGSSILSSWSVLFDSRFTPGIDRIQFALAGMNAHINHDLALALDTTNAALGLTPTPASPQFADYQSINALLNTVVPAALTMLATDTLGVLAQDTGKIGRLLAFWDIWRRPLPRLGLLPDAPQPHRPGTHRRPQRAGLPHRRPRPRHPRPSLTRLTASEKKPSAA